MRLFTLILALVSDLHGFTADKVFRAGAATSNVTPWLGVSMPGGFTDRRATKIHDELYARCLVLDDGQPKLAIVVVDNCILPRDVLDRAKAMAQKTTGIPAAHMLVSATHTHSGPAAMDIAMCKADPEYQAFLLDALPMASSAPLPILRRQRSVGALVNCPRKSSIAAGT